MAKYFSKITAFLAEMILVIVALATHLWYLLLTTFVDWPEMILYPWFLTKGLVYYRDIVLAYVPGAYYLLFVLYKLLGFSLRSERLIAYGFIFLTDILVYITAKKLTRSTWFAAAGLLFFILWQPIFYGNTIWYETMLAPLYLGAYLLALRYINISTIRNAVYLGLSLAAASLIKQTAIWSICLVCLFLWLTHKNKRAGLSHALLVGGISIAANLLVWRYFALQGAGQEFGFWSYGFLLSLTQKTSYYILSPSKSDLAVILPAFIPFLSIFVVRQKKAIWLLILWMVALLAAGLPRWGLFRLQPMLVFASVGFGLCLAQFVAYKKKWFAVLGAIVLLGSGLGSWRSFRVFITLRDPMQPQFFGAEYAGLLDFGKKHLNHPFYILGNYDYLYFGFDTKPAVLPWVPLYPWNAEVAGMQQKLIASLESQKVTYILYVPFHPKAGYYMDYVPRELLLYVSKKYEKIAPLPIEGSFLYIRK